jgi:hypothetical protein
MTSFFPDQVADRLEMTHLASADVAERGSQTEGFPLRVARR